MFLGGLYMRGSLFSLAVPEKAFPVRRLVQTCRRALRCTTKVEKVWMVSGLLQEKL
ncbi:hypothetical protein FPOAC1_004980 [Fusarium poae]|uniref:hypothetical protein n=1 Tax=Fusarium poae TaxID=36050 RepID=UPI001CE81803|nr:hypothetical protein FPOAC1_004980 [Fusarium poae]KAG8671725.1 hypothetical protein FPOAC1_004980 [Fusarium poae]